MKDSIDELFELLLSISVPFMACLHLLYFLFVLYSYNCKKHKRLHAFNEDLRYINKVR